MAYGVGRLGTWAGVTSAMAAAAIVVNVAPMGRVPASAAAPPNPCHVLKRAEIEKTFGKDVGSPSRNSGLCAWDLAGGIGKKGGGSLEVELDNGSGAAQNFEGFAMAGEAIAGPGDRAFYGPGYQFGFNVLKGGTYLRLSAAFGLLGKKPSEARVRSKLAKLTNVAVKRI
jgi:hypothetical protein